MSLVAMVVSMMVVVSMMIVVSMMVVGFLVSVSMMSVGTLISVWSVVVSGLVYVIVESSAVSTNRQRYLVSPSVRWAFYSSYVLTERM